MHGNKIFAPIDTLGINAANEISLALSKDLLRSTFTYIWRMQLTLIVKVKQSNPNSRKQRELTEKVSGVKGRQSPVAGRAGRGLLLILAHCPCDPLRGDSRSRCFLKAGGQGHACEVMVELRRSEVATMIGIIQLGSCSVPKG